MMLQRYFLLLLFFLCLCFSEAIAQQPTHFNDNPEVQAFIQSLHKEAGFDADYLNQLFSKATFREKIIAQMNHPYESQPWYKYRKLFMNKKRIAAGKAFWLEHSDTLARAEKRYGVPARIIVAILGIETYYGKYQGTYPVLDTLSTLAFYYPRRANFFKQELREFLLLSREEKLDPTSFLGSYAGAMGQGQFMPSSYRQYAVDFSGNGQRDLSHNATDAIGSIANYLHANHWQAKESIVLPISLRDEAKLKKLVLNDPKTQYDVMQLKKWGIVSARELPLQTPNKASILRFEQEDHPDYFLGFQNFYVITRYNTSPLYALAVIQLGQAIEQQYLAAKKSANKQIARHAKTDSAMEVRQNISS